MTVLRNAFWIGLLLIVGSALLVAHPHLSKSVTARIAGNEVSVAYFTSPANEDHVKDYGVGSFAPGARITFSADMGGYTMIPAGEYTLGAVRTADDDWTMALYPGRLGRGQSPDMSKVIKLTSYFSKKHGTAAHVHYDISPGAGDLAGRTTVTWHFGSLYLAGAID